MVFYFPSRLREGLGEGMFLRGRRCFDTPSPDPSRKREGSFPLPINQTGTALAECSP